MRYILDTHTLIWFGNNDSLLSDPAFAIIEKDANECYISISSLWEMTIKSGLGKLELKLDLNGFEQLLLNNNINILPITIDHLRTYKKLPLIHKDPFDRLIISQAIADELTIISKDKILEKYGVRVVW